MNLIELKRLYNIAFAVDVSLKEGDPLDQIHEAKDTNALGQICHEFVVQARRKLEPSANSEYIWLTTAPNPRSSMKGYDAGQRGWRLHAVKGELGESFAEVSNRRSLCGMAPAYGWSLDLFIDTYCQTCERIAAAQGIVLPPQQ